MTTENKKKYKQPIMNKASKDLMTIKIGKSLNVNEKFLDEFYIGLTLVMYFQTLCEQEP